MRTFLMLLAVSSFACAESRRSWDLRPLTRLPLSRPGPQIGFEPMQERLGMVEEIYRGRLDPEEVRQFIERTVDPGTWGGADNSSSIENDHLVAEAPAETLDRIGQVIDFLKALAARVVLVEVDAVELAPGAVKGLELMAGPLEDSTVAAILAAAADPARGRILNQMNVRATTGQRAHAAMLRRRTYISDFDIEVAQGATIADPISGQLDEGAVVDVEPYLSPAGDTIYLNFRFSSARIAGMADFTLPSGSGGRIELPRIDILQNRTTLALSPGKAVLTASTDFRAGTPGWTALLIVRARLENPVPAAAAPQNGRLAFRVWEAGALVKLPDYGFRGPELGLRITEGSSTGISIRMPEKFHIDDGELMEILKAATGAETWSAEGYSLAHLDNQVVACAPPQVLDKLSEKLASLEAQMGCGVAVDTWLIALDEAEWASRREAVQRSSDLPAETFDSILAVARKGDRGRILSVSSILGRSGMRFHAARGRRAAFVADYDVEIAQNSRAWDPVIEFLDDGLSVDVTAAPASQGRISIESASALAEAAMEDSFDPKSEAGGIVQTPKCERVPLWLSSPVAAGKPVLGGMMLRENGGKQEVLLYFFRGRTVAVR